MDATAAAYRTSTSTGYETEEGLPLLVLNVRRNRLVEDSLHQVRIFPMSLEEVLC